MKLAIIAMDIDAASVAAQAQSQQGKQQTTAARAIASPHDSGAPRPPVPSKPAKRGATLRDAEIGKRALQLSPVQEHAMAAVRATYSPDVKALVARLNALAQQQAAPETVKATEDTLRHTIASEHAALDSLITPDQRQRFNDAMRQAHAQASAPPPGALHGSSLPKSTN